MASFSHAVSFYLDELVAIALRTFERSRAGEANHAYLHAISELLVLRRRSAAPPMFLNLLDNAIKSRRLACVTVSCNR